MNTGATLLPGPKPGFLFCSLTLLVYQLGSVLEISVLEIAAADNTGVSDSSLFNGKDLSGWKVEGKKTDGHWQVKDGMIVGENSNKQGSVLWTEKGFKDFEFEVDYRTSSKDYDTGVFARATSHQIQIGISRSLKRDMTGCIYAPKDKKGSYPGKTDKVSKFHKVGAWNHLKIVVRGNNVKTFLNGEPFVDYDAATIPESGPIGLQLHGGVHMKVDFRNLKLSQP
ncbi:MAG: DUF1080 domain-containing protein [Planctomycetota bacterium]|nr:DUF1080 domain-containing protein [Planctomycetota bacterium]